MTATLQNPVVPKVATDTDALLAFLNTEKVPAVRANGVAYTLIERMHLWAGRAVPKATAKASGPIVLTKDQTVAWLKIQAWLKGNDRYFVLKGYAGCGKTFLVKMLVNLDSHDIAFVAPTNKATGVLSKSVNRQARTIFSFFGIRMKANDEEMVLTYPKSLPYISEGLILVVDEASMLNTELVEFLKKMTNKFKLRVLVVGDPAQFNPIGETKSPIWGITNIEANIAFLREVMRNSGPILDLCTRIRKRIANKDTNDLHDLIRSDHTDGGGVWKCSEQGFAKHLAKYNDPAAFMNTKVVAWRNKVVDAYNTEIRKSFGFKNQYDINDVLLMRSPVEIDRVIVANTDDEGIVRHVKSTTFKYDTLEVPITQLIWRMDGTDYTLRCPTGDTTELRKYLSNLASNARQSKNRREQAQYWREYWELRGKFHGVRHGYALTSHRIQGTTLTNVFAVAHDIFANPNKIEALRSAYVTFSRPTDRAYSC